MRWLVTGAGGMLGQDMVAVLRDAGEQVVPMTRADLDITDAMAVNGAVLGRDVVVNCAAWTAVDDAETRESEAFNINALGPEKLARATRDAGGRLVHISTDYVFDGCAREPYRHDHPLQPRSAYGRTKAAGERAVQGTRGNHLVIRTAWLYGAGGACFPKSIVQAVAGDKPVEVVNDQVGQPTWSADLAGLVLRMIDCGVPAGVYHGTSTGQATWCEFARVVLESIGQEQSQAKPVSSKKFVRAAPRPAFSVLASDRLESVGLQPLGNWRDRWFAAKDHVLLDAGRAAPYR